MATVLAFPNKPKQQSHREQLLAYCEQVGFPAKSYANEEFGIPAIDREGHLALAEMFRFFGVTELDPSSEDFDTVLNTWFVLTTVGTDLRAKELFPDTVYAYDSTTWHSAYLTYVEALWKGNHTEILAAAGGLNIQRGIPECASPLTKGPISDPNTA